MIYFISEATNGFIKIGWSSNVERRMANLQTANSQPLCLLAVIPGERDVEAAIHYRFRKARLLGEWFAPSEEITQYLIELRDFRCPF